VDGNLIAVSWSEFWTELQVAIAYLRSGIVSTLLDPWGPIQIFLILLAFTLTHFFGRAVEPVLEGWVRGLDTTRQRLRSLALVLRRLGLMFFVASIWVMYWVMQATTWPSRSWLIGIAASLATVWLVVAIGGRLVRNRLVARFLVAAAWTVAVLHILGLTEIAVGLLDAAAISVGEFRLSLLTLVKTIAILAALLTLASMISRFTERRVAKMEDLSPSVRVLTGKVVRIALLIVAAMIGLQSIGLDLTTLTVFSGAIGLGLGFGLQKVVSNLISGMILLIDKSIKPGDVIEVGNTFGEISHLGGRYVSVTTRDGREYLVPNEDLITSQVVNWSHTNTRVRLEVEFGVAYSADPLEVRALAIEAAKSARRVLAVPSPVCHLTEFGDSSVNYLLRFWITDPSAGVVNIRSEVLIALWYALKQSDIAIPFPQREMAFTSPIRVQMETEPESGPQPGRRRGRSRNES